MSIFSDYKVGALSDFEFEQECRRMNRIDRWERDHEYDKVDFEEHDDELVLDVEEGDNI